MTCLIISLSLLLLTAWTEKVIQAFLISDGVNKSGCRCFHWSTIPVVHFQLGIDLHASLCFLTIGFLLWQCSESWTCRVHHSNQCVCGASSSHPTLHNVYLTMNRARAHEERAVFSGRHRNVLRLPLIMLAAHPQAPLWMCTGSCTGSCMGLSQRFRGVTVKHSN